MVPCKQANRMSGASRNGPAVSGASFGMDQPCVRHLSRDGLAMYQTPLSQRASRIVAHKRGFWFSPCPGWGEGQPAQRIVASASLRPRADADAGNARRMLLRNYRQDLHRLAPLALPERLGAKSAVNVPLCNARWHLPSMTPTDGDGDKYSQMTDTQMGFHDARPPRRPLPAAAWARRRPPRALPGQIPPHRLAHLLGGTHVHTPTHPFGRSVEQCRRVVFRRQRRARFTSLESARRIAAVPAFGLRGVAPVAVGL
mmetsp:Transcript_18383/g.42118  ORF Transcript_18383/g.42118 Transcript_18383/m.42118 type:complete len:256 (-) Transcript_18383:243-1010(-)